MEYLEVKGFRQSLGALKAKGMYSTAVEQVWATYGRINADESYEQIFGALTATHHGETRVANCVKYDLQGRARLVTVTNNGICLFLFAGTHDDVDGWLDRNKGL